MKKLTNLKGAKTLDKAQQQEINGALKKRCDGNCVGKPNMSACFYLGHCNCPGECYYGECIPY